MSRESTINLAIAAIAICLGAASAAVTPLVLSGCATLPDIPVHMNYEDWARHHDQMHREQVDAQCQCTADYHCAMRIQDSPAVRDWVIIQPNLTLGLTVPKPVLSDADRKAAKAIAESIAEEYPHE